MAIRGPYTYLWSNGATSASILYFPGFTYSLSVTDANGCAAYQYFYANTTGIQLDSINAVTNPTCTSSGSITANPINGVAPYTYTWSNGATTAAITGLTAPGSYHVIVTDANGCTGESWYYISTNTISVNVGTGSVSCGMSDGSITLYTYYGTLPYTYTWSNSGTNNTNTDASLSAGTYAYTVSDAAGCSVTGSEVLTGRGHFFVTVSTVPTSCDPNNPTGATNVTVADGGTAPFTFNWIESSAGYYIYPVTNGGLTGLSNGTYVALISATDANGCVDSTINYAGQDTAGGYINFASTCYNDITGYAYLDLNGNCIQDGTEPGKQGVNIIVINSNGQQFYGNTDSTGFYDIQVLPGTYTVAGYSNYTNYCNSLPCTASYTQTFSGTGAIASGNNFGYSVTNSFDLTVHTGYLPSAPGSTKEYWVYYYNQGTSDAINAVLTFVHDPNLTLASTNPPYSSYNAGTQTITWNVGTVPVSYLNTNQEVTMQFNVPSNLALGTLLSATSSITPAIGDCNPLDNAETLTDPVTASHDPNSKEVSPSGNITASDSVLNYTIRFQNTGNAPATKVVITDTLSSLVDPASVIAGASSNKYTFTLSGNGILTFTFDPIYLPDSSQSVDSSQGFVMYSVHVRNNNAIGQQIKNTAYIYFDLNPAVVTNTTVSTLSNSTGIKTISAGAMSVAVSPNPVHDISQFSISGATGEVIFNIEDIAGQRIFEKTTSDSNLMFNSETFSAGIYIYTARDAKGNTCTGKIVIAH